MLFSGKIEVPAGTAAARVRKLSRSLEDAGFGIEPLPGGAGVQVLAPGAELWIARRFGLEGIAPFELQDLIPRSFREEITLKAAGDDDSLIRYDHAYWSPFQLFLHGAVTLLCVLSVSWTELSGREDALLPFALLLGLANLVPFLLTCVSFRHFRRQLDPGAGLG